MASNCENCGIRRRAERKPNSILARLWRWHTKWCPGWKAYQAELAAREQELETRPSKE
jgi:hypothetical protein